MDLISSPLAILAVNAVAAILLALLKDVVNNVWWGETQLVLQRLSTNRKPARAETPHVEISGRRAGVIGYLLTLFDLSPKVTLSANTKEVRKSSSSLHGHSLELIPLSQSVSIQADSQRSLFWLLAAILSLTVGVASGLLMGQGFSQKLLNGVAWLAVAGMFLFAFYQSHRFQIVVHGTLRAGVSFKPSVLEGRAIHFQEVAEAVELLMERVQESRFLGVPVPAVAPGTPPGLQAVASTPAGLKNVSLSKKSAPPFAPADQNPFEDADETLTDTPFPVKSPPAPPKQPTPPERSNTGTVEYGEDHPAFEAAPGIWNGSPEPGTSDSIQLRQSITRSETGMFLGVAGKLNDMEDYLDEELDAPDTHPSNNTHRGTVSWEEHADKPQDEMRAEAELADLKRSRPKRGEAKLRLRELMRRFPQTEASKKARHLLERLESGS